jgi:hypothetical protein
MRIKIGTQLPSGGVLSPRNELIGRFPQAKSRKPKGPSKASDDDRGQQSKRPLVFVGGFENATGVKLKSDDRFDTYGAFFTKGMVCLVLLAGVFAILKRL